MGRKSTKENKNIYHIKREEMGLSREAASEMMCISTDRIESIENDPQVIPRPEEVLLMSNVYQYPNLCNYYCSHDCDIGREYVPEIQSTDNLFEIIVKTVDSINKVDSKKNRLLEIIADGLISEDEIRDFVIIQDLLEKVSINVETLQLWLEKQGDTHKISMEKINAAKAVIKQTDFF